MCNSLSVRGSELPAGGQFPSYLLHRFCLSELFFLPFLSTAMLGVEALHLSRTQQEQLSDYFLSEPVMKIRLKWKAAAHRQRSLVAKKGKEKGMSMVCDQLVMRWLLSSICFACSYLKCSGQEAFEETGNSDVPVKWHLTIITAMITGLLHTARNWNVMFKDIPVSVRDMKGQHRRTVRVGPSGTEEGEG